MMRGQFSAAAGVTDESSHTRTIVKRRYMVILFLFLGFTRLPEDIRLSGVFVERARHNEQQVRQPVQVFNGNGRDAFHLPQRDRTALRTPTHGARQVAERRRAATAWQDELLEWGQIGI